MTSVSWESAENEKLVIEVSDIFGKVHYSETIAAVAGFNTHSISVSDFNDGWYSVTLAGNHFRVQQRLLKGR
jgi:hypothetical protein